MPIYSIRKDRPDLNMSRFGLAAIAFYWEQLHRGLFSSIQKLQADHLPILKESFLFAPIGGSVDLDAAIWRLKLNKDKTERLNLVLRAVRNVNQLLVKEKDRARLIQGICDNLIENRGYHNAWIVLLDEAGRLVLTAEAGLGDKFPLIAEQMKRGALTGCARSALTQSGVVLTEDPVSNCRDCPLSGSYTGRGGMTVRLEYEGDVYGIMSVSIPKAFIQNREEHGLVEEIAGDIAFKLHTIGLEEERRQVREALRENEKALSRIVQANPIPTFVINNKRVVTHWNSACENLTGISSDKMIGTQNQWLAFYSEERPLLADFIIDNAKDDEIAKYYAGKYRKNDVIEEGYEAEDFFPNLGENGKWLFFAAAPLRDTKGKVTGAIETFQDVSERKWTRDALNKSEKLFRDLIEYSLIGICIIQDDQVVYQNPEQARLLGPLPRPSKLIDYESVHPDDVEKTKGFHRDLTLRKVRSQEMEFRFYPVDESGNRLDMKWVHCRASLIEYEARDAILVNMMDVTRAKELENDLRVQDKMSSLGRVAAGIAHEIRNPLSGINIYLNTMEKIYDRGDRPEQLKQIFKQLQSASNKIESVIRRVMDFSKPSEPSFVSTDINKPIEEALSLSSVTLRKRGIKLEKALAEDMPRCKGDPQLIEQVILNLLTNAAEAMKNMGGEKRIGVSSTMENDCIAVRVFDSGPGVPFHVKEKVFDPFYTTKNGSTGIGLSLSHRIITDHGGSLTVYPSEWGGAEFRIEIPLARVTESK